MAALKGCAKPHQVLRINFPPHNTGKHSFRAFYSAEGIHGSNPNMSLTEPRDLEKAFAMAFQVCSVT